MVTFPCPLCKNSIEAEARPGTHHVDCPTCKGMVRVPPLARQVDDPHPLPGSAPKRPLPLAAITGIIGVVSGLMFGLFVGVIVGRYALAPAPEVAASPTSTDQGGALVAVAPAASATTVGPAPAQASPQVQAGGLATPWPTGVPRPVAKREPPKGKTVTQEELMNRIMGMTLKDVNAFMGPPDYTEPGQDRSRPRLLVQYLGRVIDKTGRRKSVTLFMYQGVVEDYAFSDGY